jgi:hypothetical protein
MTPSQMASTLRGIASLQVLAPIHKENLREAAQWIDEQDAQNESPQDEVQQVANVGTNEQYTSIEAAIQLLTSAVLNQRTELLVIKAEVMKLNDR